MPKNNVKKISYHKGIFDEFMKEPNPEHCENFPETMWGLGFDMDCYSSAPDFYNYPWDDTEHTEKDRQDVILAEMEKWPMQIVGNYIFSRYRELTHWSDYGYPEEQGHYFFARAFPILARKIM